jgi:hypothetical protein
MATAPQFDSVRATLVFAFNSDEDGMRAPVMSREMAQHVEKKTQDRMAEPSAEEFLPIPPQLERLRGLDKVAQAAFICKLLSKLDEPEGHMLVAVCRRQRDPCNCRSACCRGWKVNRQWGEAMSGLLAWVQTTAEVVEPGKRGMSTLPELRAHILGAYVSGRGDVKDLSLSHTAEKHGVSPTTVAKHRDLLWACLEALERRAWVEIAQIFDDRGITGFLK